MNPAPPQVRQGGGGKRQVPMRVPKMAELLATRIRRQIILGQLEEGELLLPEAQLLEQSGVSRPTLREAFRILESESFIAVNRGSRGGARILAPKIDVAVRYAGIYLQHANTTFEDVQMVRALLEPPAARTLAERSDPEAIQALRDHIALEAESVTDAHAFAELSTGFHQLVMDLAGNKTLTLVVAMLGGVIEKCSTRVLELIFDIENTKTAVRSHQRLVDLIEKGDAQQALTHWRKHLQSVAQVQVRALGSDQCLDVMG
ncbi:MAG: FadR/GntR family transcriptional regulator [Myxococcota bacterium]